MDIFKTPNNMKKNFFLNLFKFERNIFNFLQTESTFLSFFLIVLHSTGQYKSNFQVSEEMRNKIIVEVKEPGTMAIIALTTKKNM